MISQGMMSTENTSQKKKLKNMSICKESKEAMTKHNVANNHKRLTT